MTDWQTVRTFGVPDGRLPHVVRPSAYALILGASKRLAIVHTSSGSYLPGGGLQAGEAPEAAICREAREECGLTLALGRWRREAVDHITVVREHAHFEKRCTFGSASVVGPPSHPIETDHRLTWLTPEEALDVLTPPSHRWAVAEWLTDPAVATGPAAASTNARTVIHKAVACVVRRGPQGPELLVFRHPVAGIQVPKGSVEPGELPEDAAVRELAEESGMSPARVARQVGHHVIEVGAGAAEAGPEELQVWHTFLLTTEAAHPEQWSHRVTGSEVENGLVFEYFWLPLAEARRVSAARFHHSIDFIAQACASEFSDIAGLS